MRYNPNPKLPVPLKSELIHLHKNKGMSGRQMADYYKVSQMQIRRWFREREIIPRSRNKAPSGRPPTGEKNWNWKGDKVSYQALHSWVRRHKGTPHECEKCGTTEPRKYEWANISGEYKRDLSDWIRVCTKCHRKMDKK
jgi:hypothetical protein